MRPPSEGGARFPESYPLDGKPTSLSKRIWQQRKKVVLPESLHWASEPLSRSGDGEVVAQAWITIAKDLASEADLRALITTTLSSLQETQGSERSEKDGWKGVEDMLVGFAAGPKAKFLARLPFPIQMNSPWQPSLDGLLNRLAPLQRPLARLIQLRKQLEGWEYTYPYDWSNSASAPQTFVFPGPIEFPDPGLILDKQGAKIYCYGRWVKGVPPMAMEQLEALLYSREPWVKLTDGQPRPLQLRMNNAMRSLNNRVMSADPAGRKVTETAGSRGSRLLTCQASDVLVLPRGTAIARTSSPARSGRQLAAPRLI